MLKTLEGVSVRRPLEKENRRLTNELKITRTKLKVQNKTIARKEDVRKRKKGIAILRIRHKNRLSQLEETKTALEEDLTVKNSIIRNLLEEARDAEVAAKSNRDKIEQVESAIKALKRKIKEAKKKHVKRQKSKEKKIAALGQQIRTFEADLKNLEGKMEDIKTEEELRLTRELEVKDVECELSKQGFQVEINNLLSQVSILEKDSSELKTIKAALAPHFHHSGVDMKPVT